MVQAALLCQIFGTLSFESGDNIMTDIFHGAVVACARRIGAFGVGDDDFLFKNTSSDESFAAWQGWSYREQYRRLAMALYIQDANMASRHHHDPLLRHFAKCYDQCTCDDLFDAADSQEWYYLFRDIHAMSMKKKPMKIMEWMVQGQVQGQLQDQGNRITSLLKTSAFYSYSILANLNACVIESPRL